MPRSSATTMPRILYLSHNGLCEPLGQRQILAYVTGLSSTYRFSIISFEKPEDLANTALMNSIAQMCRAQQIDWMPQRFRYRPAIWAPLWSMFTFFWYGLRTVRRQDVCLIHARSYIPSAVAALIGGVTGVPFVFDMRGLWPEELIAAGRLVRGSWVHRMIIWAERTCLRRATGVVSLTQAAARHLTALHAGLDKRLVVIPTCADLKCFVPAPAPPKSFVFGCVGSLLTGWFRMDLLKSCIEVLASQNPQAHFELLTRDSADQVRSILALPSALEARLRISALSARDVPAAVQQHSVSMMFFTQGLSKLGSAPTRMGEVLGSGIPIIANAGVGDMAAIIHKYRVGVLVTEDSPAAMRDACHGLAVLLQDPDLSGRCRQAALEIFSLEAGVAAYQALYHNCLTQRASCAL